MGTRINLYVMLSMVAGCAQVKEKPAAQAPPPPAAVVETPRAPPPVVTPAPPAATDTAATAEPIAAARSPRVATPPKPPAAPAARAKPPVSGAAKPPAARQPAAAAAVAPPTPAGSATKPQLDFKALEQRLRDTSAIGVFTKLSLKNQVDDLLKSFRGYYAGRVPPSLDDLRQRYDGLLLKVVSLLQDDDAPLASAISASRSAIWERLSNKESFQAI